MISFIVPATDKKQIKTLETSLEALGMPFELIPIYGATSFFDAWRKGVPKAKGEYLCLTHQDTKFVAFPDPAKYLKDKVGMLGTAGTTVLHKDQPWWFSQERFLGHILSGQIWNTEMGKDPSMSVFGDFGEVVVLDGVCLITTKKILEEVLPSCLDKGYGTWDFYDHVISLELIKKGYKLLTVPIVIVHGSKGGDKRPSFFESMEKFTKEYLDKTWRV
jgi:GT2 family glycosyltransferase